MDLSSLKKSEEVLKDVDRLATDLEKLRLSYEQYFLGLERLEPLKLRTALADTVRKYSGSPMQNVRQKFRFQQLVARYNTYVVYWDRVLKEMEEGRYQRDVFKAKIHEKERLESTGKPTVPEKPKQDPFATLFAAYLAERTKNNEPTGQLPFEKFKAQLQNQIETIKKKTGVTNIKIQIVSEAGKAKIKAVPQASKKMA